MDPLYAKFGTLVKAARGKAGLTQAQLAQAIGLTRTSIANIEAGRQRAFLDTAYRIAEAVGCAPDELLPDAADLREGHRLPAAVESQPPAVRQWIEDVFATPPHTEEDPTDEEGSARGAPHA